jgi:hypothetical protein
LQEGWRKLTYSTFSHELMKNESEANLTF